MNKRTPLPWNKTGLVVFSGKQPVTIATWTITEPKWLTATSELDEAEANAAYIVEACNGYESLKAREAVLVDACKAWLLWDSEVYSAKETGESEYSYGELQALRQDAEYKARAALKGKV